MKASAVLLALCLLGACARVPDRTLSFEFLTAGEALTRPAPTAEYAPPVGAIEAGNTFKGRLRADTVEKVDHFLLLLDEFGLVPADNAAYAWLPAFDFEFVQHGELLIPMTEGPVINDHPKWEWVLQTGRVWEEPDDNGWSRAALPFALKEKREDCTFNGLMSFLFNDAGDVSSLAFQVTNETCRYLQFDMSGLLEAEYLPGEVDGSEARIADALAQRDRRLPTRPIASLADHYPDANAAAFGAHEEIEPSDMTAYGLVIDGTHYVSQCETPYGDYPYCDDMALPSYSTAKSVVAGFGLMLLEKEYPGAADAVIEGLVPECGATWADVTIEHALDMTTGHFGQSSMHGDEDASNTSRFFLGDHADKIDVACNGYPRKAEPGTHLAYHTWDTYLAGSAINAFLRERRGPDADFFDDLILEKIWKPLGLSSIAAATRRSYDEHRQPHSGFGLTLLRDDVVKLAQFIGPMDGRIDGADVVGGRLFDEVKQRLPEVAGLVAELETIRYNNGFRSFDVSSYLGCDEPAWVVVLSGFGGIIVAVMPNDTAYYYFSDGNVHRYLAAVRESHRIRPMCR